MYDTKKIKRLLAERSMTQASLAQQANLGEGTVSRVMLTGNARFETAKKIAAVLKVDPVELIEEEA